MTSSSTSLLEVSPKVSPSSDPEEVGESLNPGLDENKQTEANPEKPEMLLVGSVGVLGSGCALILDGIACSLMTFVHSLGVLLDPACC